MTKILEDLKKFIEEKRPTYYGVYTCPSDYDYVAGKTLPKKYKLVKVTLKGLNIDRKYSCATGSGIIQPWENAPQKDSHPNSWSFDARKSYTDDDTIIVDFNDYGEETVLLVKVSKDFKILYSLDSSTCKEDGMVLIIDEYETVKDSEC